MLDGTVLLCVLEHLSEAIVGGGAFCSAEHGLESHLEDRLPVAKMCSRVSLYVDRAIVMYDEECDDQNGVGGTEGMKASGDVNCDRMELRVIVANCGVRH